MISGPVLPRNHAGLWELIDGHLDDVERGLVVVERDLELEPDCRVDALLKDAAGRPVFLLLAHPELEHELPARLLALRGWLVSGLALLARFVRHDGLDYELPPRLLALGFELPGRVLQQLGELRNAGVEVHQFCSLRIGGRERGGLMPALGAEGSISCGSVQSVGRLPSGVRDPKVETLGARFLDLMQRLDPDVQVTGDRYSRAFTYAGVALAELQLCDGGLQVSVPLSAPASADDGDDGDDADEASAIDVRQLRDPDDGRHIADLVMRRYLQVLGSDRSTAGEPSPTRIPPAQAPESADPRALSLERLRATVDTSQLSPEEYSVLGEAGPDDD